jgi:glycosyltransferase involved in cell wall biosynthesis
MNPKISICIPVWEQHGVGLQYLIDLIKTIELQTFKDFEIVISDHSKNDNIFHYLTSLNGHLVKYTRFLKNYGNGVSNLNQALKLASGEIIKIMFQDDFMISPDCLKITYDTFQNTQCDWLVCGSNHTSDGIKFYREIIPHWNDNILYGNNTISSPSVLSIKNNNINFFDENLTMLMDVEYYYRQKLRSGIPIVIPDCLISNRIHSNQISARYDKNINDEIEYIKKKYDYN